MRQWGVLILAACVIAAGCGSDSPSSPSTNPNQVMFTASLSAANEVPPVTNAESAGRGTATITMNLSRNSSGAIQSGTIDFQFTLTNFPNGSLATLAHIHTGAAGVAGGVLINTGLTAATALGLPVGSGSFEARGIAADAATLQAIIDNPSNYYFNVHTSLNPGGAVRGQLVKQ